MVSARDGRAAGTNRASLRGRTAGGPSHNLRSRRSRRLRPERARRRGGERRAASGLARARALPAPQPGADLDAPARLDTAPGRLRRRLRQWTWTANRASPRESRLHGGGAKLGHRPLSDVAGGSSPSNQRKPRTPGFDARRAQPPARARHWVLKLVLERVARPRTASAAKPTRKFAQRANNRLLHRSAARAPVRAVRP
jgi:hypothetical protein